MKNKILENAEIRERVKKGLDLTFEKLIKAKKLTDGTLVFSKDGIIEKVKASDIKI